MSGAIRSLVERHARGLEDIAAAMQKDGIGLHSTRGHVPVLRRMAEAMRGDATRGKTPHDFVDYPAGMYAAADTMTLPFAVANTQSGIDLGTGDPIAISTLNASMDAADVSPSDRILTKQTLAQLGKLTT